MLQVYYKSLYEVIKELIPKGFQSTIGGHRYTSTRQLLSSFMFFPDSKIESKEKNVESCGHGKLIFFLHEFHVRSSPYQQVVGNKLTLKMDDV